MTVKGRNKLGRKKGPTIQQGYDTHTGIIGKPCRDKQIWSREFKKKKSVELVRAS